MPEITYIKISAITRGLSSLLVMNCKNKLTKLSRANKKSCKHAYKPLLSSSEHITFCVQLAGGITCDFLFERRKLRHPIFTVRLDFEKYSRRVLVWYSENSSVWKQTRYRSAH